MMSLNKLKNASQLLTIWLFISHLKFTYLRRMKESPKMLLG